METGIIVLGIISILLLMTYLRNRKAKRFAISVDTERCTGCGLCAKRCRRNVLIIEKQEDGKRRAVVAHPSQCSACGHCTEVCRFNALELSKRKS